MITDKMKGERPFVRLDFTNLKSRKSITQPFSPGERNQALVISRCRMISKARIAVAPAVPNE